MWNFLGPLLAPLLKFFGMLFGAGAAVGTGAVMENARQARADKKAAEDRAKVDDQVLSQSDAELDKEIDRWST